VVIAFASYEKGAAVGENCCAVTCARIAERNQIILPIIVECTVSKYEGGIDHHSLGIAFVDAACDQRAAPKRSCARPGTAIRAELPGADSLAGSRVPHQGECGVLRMLDPVEPRYDDRVAVGEGSHRLAPVAR
jgi:hypothetical protein